MDAPVKQYEPIGTVNPAIEQAYQDGRLAIGDVADFYTVEGIPLPDKTNLVVALHMQAMGSGSHLGPRLSRHVTLADIDALGAAEPHPQFEGGEHTAIGDRVLLYFSSDDKGTPAYQVPLSLPNGLNLTYGQILALGGDFYGIPEQAISDGASPADRQQRFANAYNSLAQNPSSCAEATQILAVMQIEIDAV